MAEEIKVISMCRAFGVGIVLTVIIVALPMGVVSSCNTRQAINDAWRKDMIERGYAEYNSTTGEWQWKENSSGKSSKEDGQSGS